MGDAGIALGGSIFTASTISSIIGLAMDGLDEELVCYPAGALARLVVAVLEKAGMFKNKGISLNRI